MPQFVGKFYLSYEGQPVPREELIKWLLAAGMVDFDTEGVGLPEDVDGVSCLLDWESIKEIK